MAWLTTPFASLINACCALMKHFDNCTLLHIYREGNSVADGLAKSFILTKLLPAWIGSLLLDDILGVAKARLVCSDSF